MTPVDSLITVGLIGLNAFAAGGYFAIGDMKWAALNGGVAAFLIAITAVRCLA